LKKLDEDEVPLNDPFAGNEGSWWSNSKFLKVKKKMK